MDRHRAFSSIWDTLLAVMRHCLVCAMLKPNQVQQFPQQRGSVKSRVRANLNLLEVAWTFPWVTATSSKISNSKGQLGVLNPFGPSSLLLVSHLRDISILHRNQSLLLCWIMPFESGEYSLFIFMWIWMSMDFSWPLRLYYGRILFVTKPTLTI